VNRVMWHGVGYGYERVPSLFHHCVCYRLPTLSVCLRRQSQTYHLGWYISVTFRGGVKTRCIPYLEPWSGAVVD
jgi:hypothetical protein